MRFHQNTRKRGQDACAFAGKKMKLLAGCALTMGKWPSHLFSLLSHTSFCRTLGQDLYMPKLSSAPGVAPFCGGGSHLTAISPWSLLFLPFFPHSWNLTSAAPMRTLMSNSALLYSGLRLYQCLFFRFMSAESSTDSTSQLGGQSQP